MISELIRAHLPEDVGREETCGICGEKFRTEVVLAPVLTEDRYEMGRACPACVELLGKYKPQKFPTIEEYRALEATWRTPLWSSAEEATRAWESGKPYLAVLEASRVSRA